MLDEAEHALQHEELHEGDADVGQRTAEEDQRQGELLLVRVQARSDEGPDLVHDPRQRQQHGGHGQHLERNDEWREHAHRDQLGALGHVVPDGSGDEVDQTVRPRPEGQQRDGDQNAVDAVEQAVAQLHQVLNERLLGAGQFVVFGRRSVSHGQTKARAPGGSHTGIGACLGARTAHRAWRQEKLAARWLAQSGFFGRNRATRAAPDCALVRTPERDLYHCGVAPRLTRQFLRGWR